jgi:antitoxin component of MazEF toxin-antitoxin module
MKRTIQETSGSYVINLPREFAKDLGLRKGDKVDFEIRGRTIVMTPVLQNGSA